MVGQSLKWQHVSHFETINNNKLPALILVSAAVARFALLCGVCGMVQGCIPIQCPTSGFYIITVVFVQQMLSVSYSQSYFTYILTRLPVIFAPRNGSQCEKARWDVGRTKQSEVNILISQSCRACITMCASLTPDSYKQISIQFSKRHLCTLSVDTIRRLPTLESTSSI